MSTSHAMQYEKVPLPVGRIGMWWFLASEVTIFGAIIASYGLLRLRHPDWAESASHTLSLAGLINTFILLTSSLTIVLAHQSVQEKNLKKAKSFLIYTLLLGLAFLAIKVFEYAHEIHAGYIPSTNLFWSYYFFMTGLHALHIIIGLVIMTFFIAMIEKQSTRVEYLGLYWHLVDIVWIFLFPLIYLGG